MDEKKPWTVGSDGQVHTKQKKTDWSQFKWGQIVCFSYGGLALLVATGESGYSESHTKIAVGGALMALGVALRALDIWKNRP